MKGTLQVLKFACIPILLGALILNCKKNDGAPENPVTPPGGSLNADTISNHLLFSNATKITGTIPNGPTNCSLKISIEDTFYLVDKWKLPIEFLHEDTTKNVTGVYIQVQAGSTKSTFYYDVPEVPDIATNDTVSVILMGIDLEGLKNLIDTAGCTPFTITLALHGSNGQALCQGTVPVCIAPADIPTPADISGDISGLVTKEGDYWKWTMSFTPDPNIPGKNIFLNHPNKLWGLNGQLIQGCCTNGISSYTTNCIEANKRSLTFKTFFKWPNEIYKFFGDGTYTGLSEFISADPDPQASNFCGTGNGIVNLDIDRYVLQGTWTVSSTMFLTTVGTSTPQGGSLAARPLGTIKLVSSRNLIIVQPGLGGGGSDLVKFYTRQNSSSPNWFPF